MNLFHRAVPPLPVMGSVLVQREVSAYQTTDIICCERNKRGPCAPLRAVIFIFTGLHLKLSHVPHLIMVYKNLYLHGNSAQC